MKKFSEYNQQINEGIISDFFKWLFGIGKEKTKYTNDTPSKIKGKDFFAFNTEAMKKELQGKTPKLTLMSIKPEDVNDEQIEKLCNGENTDINKKTGLWWFKQYYEQNKNTENFSKTHFIDIVTDEETKFPYAIFVHGDGQLLREATDDTDNTQDKGIIKFLGILCVDVYADKNINTDDVAKQMFSLINDKNFESRMKKLGYEGIKINKTMLQSRGLDKYLPNVFNQEEKGKDNVVYASWSFNKNEPIVLNPQDSPNSKIQWDNDFNIFKTVCDDIGRLESYCADIREFVFGNKENAERDNKLFNIENEWFISNEITSLEDDIFWYKFDKEQRISPIQYSKEDIVGKLDHIHTNINYIINDINELTDEDLKSFSEESKKYSETIFGNISNILSSINTTSKEEMLKSLYLDKIHDIDNMSPEQEENAKKQEEQNIVQQQKEDEQREEQQDTEEPKHNDETDGGEKGSGQGDTEQQDKKKDEFEQDNDNTESAHKVRKLIDGIIDIRKEIKKLVSLIAKLPSNSVSLYIKKKSWYQSNKIKKLTDGIFESKNTSMADRNAKNGTTIDEIKSIKDELLQSFEKAVTELLKGLKDVQDKDVSKIVSGLEGFDEIDTVDKLKKHLKIDNIQDKPSEDNADNSEQEATNECYAMKGIVNYINENRNTIHKMKTLVQYINQ